MDVRIGLDDVVLPGDLVGSDEAAAAVVFAHGSGSSHRSPRNRAVAARLHDAGLATLLFDLLTEAESADRDLVFDIPLLTERLLGATDWMGEQADRAGRWIGYFGASTGAAAALSAAARRPEQVGAVVSRGGRPDLVAADDLRRLEAPTLLIVGGHDPVVVGLNQDVDRVLRCEHRLEVVPGATHLFEEPGATDRVTDLATNWFRRYLPPSGAAAQGEA